MTVKLFGKEYAVTFNMAVQIEFEELSGLPFDFDTLNTQKATMQLCYASLNVANGKLPFSFDQLIGKELYNLACGLSVEETAELKNAVIAEMHNWYAIPVVMQDDDKQPQEDDPKNV